MKNLVLLIFYVSLLCAPKKSQAQDKWQIGMGAAIATFSDGNTGFEDEKQLFQFPRLNVTKIINERFSVNWAISFNSLKFVEISENKANYFSIDSFLRYSLTKESNFLDPYIFVGASLVSVNIKFVPALNFGVGNTFWIIKNFGINAQAMYKLSEKNTSHFQFTAGFVYNLSSGRKNLWD